MLTEPTVAATRAGSSVRGEALTPPQRRTLVAILAVAAAVRLAWAVYTTEEPIAFVSGDAFSYYYYGQELASGHDLVGYVGGQPTAYYPIGYPAILAAPFWLVRHTPITDNLPMAGSILNVVFGTLSVLLVFVIARRVLGATGGLAAAAATALFPNLVYYTSTLQLETAFIFLTLAAVAVLVTHDWSAGAPGRDRLLVFGATLGLSALVRPFSLPIVAGLVAAVLVTGHGWRRAAATVGWTMIPLAVLFTPWTVRNIVVMDAPIVFSTNMGDTLCLDRSLDATGRFRFTDHEGCVDPDKPETERNSENTRKAIEFVLEHPDRELRQVLERGWYMMKEDHDGLIAVEAGGNDPFLGHRLRTILTRTADWYYYAVLVLGALGLPGLLRGRRPEGLVVAVAILTLLAIPLALWGNPRFHLPALPFLAISAAGPLAWLFSRRAAVARSTPGRPRDDGIPALSR